MSHTVTKHKTCDNFVLLPSDLLPMDVFEHSLICIFGNTACLFSFSREEISSTFVSNALKNVMVTEHSTKDIPSCPYFPVAGHKGCSQGTVFVYSHE